MNPRELIRDYRRPLPGRLPLRNIVTKAQAQARAEAPATTVFGVGVPGRAEVEFKDGKRIWLMRVERAGAPDLFLRELGAPAAGTVIDLRQLLPDVEKDLPQTSTRDVAGYVAISLRLKFATREAFLEAAVQSGRPQA